MTTSPTSPPPPPRASDGSPQSAGGPYSQPQHGRGLVGWVRRVPETYFRTTPPAPPDVIARTLWVGDGTPEWRGQDTEYRAALLEQYKVYVEMADRISARRGLANTFFLTLNTAIATAIGVLWQHPPHGPRWFLIIPLFALLAQCLAWFLIIRSYRQLNGAKYNVVGAMETRLPASPYYAGEWTALGEGRDPRIYLPLSHVEQLIPAFFAVIYVVAFIAGLFT